jgi:multiple sugar transport system substrate-binding protein
MAIRLFIRFPRRVRLWLGLLLGLLIVVLISCNNQTSNPGTNTEQAPPVLRIYWNRGFYSEEDQALQKVVSEWEQQKKTAVQLSFFSSDDILNQTAIALENNNAPDIVFAHRADYTLEPRWALEGKLVEVSDVLGSVKDKYSSTALKAAYSYDKADQKRGYYGIPIEVQAIHIHYWRDLLEQVGLKDSDIPNDWQGFWDFWRQAQDRLRQSGQKEIYGLGLPLSTKASDTFFLFEQILDAYNIELLDQQGQLQLSNPKVRQGIITALDWLTQFYRDQYVPPEALNWVDSDNNVNFLNRSTLMTANPSLSIPASQREDNEVYTKRIATREFPSKPNGQPMNYLVSVKQALIFKESKNTKAAKDFLAYLIQPERLNTYVKGSLGRWFPVMPDSLQDAFWKNSTDRHVAVAVRQFAQRPTRPFYHALNPAYSQVQAENVWGQAMSAILVEGKSSEAAVDEAIGHIQTIFAEWQK